MAGSIGAAILGGTQVGSSVAQYNAAGDAADAVRDASRSSNALQRYIYDQNRADQAPWRDTGVAALQQLGSLYGLNGQPANFDAFTASPDYQFALQQGQNQLDRQASARGGLYSGQQLKAAQQFGQGLASQQFGNYFNRLGTIAGFGQNATNQLGAFGQNYANQVGRNNMIAADAQASSYADRGNALSGLFDSIGYGAGRLGGG